MRGHFVLLVAFVSVLALAVPASAGTAEDPDFKDVCAGAQDGYTSNVKWIDICSGWLTPQDSGFMATLKLDTAEASPSARTFLVQWFTDGCTFSIGYNPRTGIDAGPQGELTGPGVARFNMSCGDRPCTNTPLPNCHEPVRSASVDLPAEDVFILDGNTVRLMVDFSTPKLAEFAAAHAPGTTLTALYAAASMGPGNLSLDACSGSSCVSPFVDGAFGRDFTIPARD